MKPPFVSLSLNYPNLSTKREDLFKMLGWDSLLNNEAYRNTCAIRLSVAILRSGFMFPHGGLVVQSGPLKGKRIEPSQAKLSHMLVNLWGEPEKFGGMFDARSGIGERRGVVSFFKINPMITIGSTRIPANGGHIDLVQQSMNSFEGRRVSDCKMQCYFGAIETWFWSFD